LKLWEKRDIIDEFVLSDFKKMDEEEKAIVSNWNKAIHGKFIVDRHLRKGSVLISVDNNEVYIVKYFCSNITELLSKGPGLLRGKTDRLLCTEKHRVIVY